jgi:DNA-binding SARP family transcriptional activator/predicted ATPase
MSSERNGTAAGDLPIRIALFGQPHVTAADGRRDFPLPRKTLNVLAYLILHRRRPPAREAVAFALFPDEDEEVARGSLRRNLSYLLSSLPQLPAPQRFVAADNKTIAWNAEAPAIVDVDAFETAVAEGRDDDAIAAYAGELLPTLYDEWTMGERERLRDAFHETLLRVVRRDRSLRRFDHATAAAHRLLDEDPWREDTVRQLIAIRYEAGDRTGALAVFERFVIRLRAEMHAEPMPETIALRDAILRGARLATSETVARRGTGDVPAATGLPLVGRDDAMRTARTFWHDAADGRTGMLFVAGEAGIGKSRFAIELARSIEREGGLVIRGETSAGGEQRPYEAFVEALRSAEAARSRASTHDADVWRNVLEQLLDEHAGAALVDDRSARVRLFDSVRRGIADLARTRPVVVILEDLHWAGSATIELLDFIALRLGHAPVLFVATLRTDEISGSHPLRALLRGLESRGGAGVISLPRLSAADAAAALREALPAETTDETIEDAVARADGIPLLLAESLRDIGAGREATGGDVTALVGDRFARLSPAAETALVYGAVLGARFELAPLAAATGWPDDELIEALGESIELGLIRARVKLPGLAFAFTHHLVHAAARDLISPPDRTRAHALVARVLAALPAQGGARAAEIARHYELAGEARRAAEQYAVAARYALDVFANGDARDAAGAGLALLAPDPKNRGLRYDLLAARERALARSGSRSDRRIDADALVELANDDPERALTALERQFHAYLEDVGVRDQTLARLAVLSKTSDRAAAVYERAVADAAYNDGDFMRTRDAALRAADHFERCGDAAAALAVRCMHINSLARLAAYDDAREAIESLRPVAEANDDAALRAEFHRVASSCETYIDGALALSDARRSLELALRVGDRYAEARAHQNVGVGLGGFAHDYAGALGEHERALAAYRDVGDAYGVFDTTLNLATVRGFCGDTDGALRLLDGLEYPPAKQSWFLMRAAANRGSLAVRAGAFADAERDVTTARALALELGTSLYATRMQGCLGEIRAHTGQPGEGLSLLGAAIAGLESLGQETLSARLHAVKARVHAELGERDEAQRHLDVAADLAEHRSIQHLGEMAWNMAAAAAQLDDRAAAERFAQMAARAFATEAMRMDADLAEAYSRLPWHVDALAYLAGRAVPLHLNGR